MDEAVPLIQECSYREIIIIGIYIIGIIIIVVIIITEVPVTKVTKEALFSQ